MKMNTLNRFVFKIFVPKFIRRRIDLNKTKKIILNYYGGLPTSSITAEEKTVLDYLKEQNLCTFPYPFQFKYKKKDISILNDADLGLRYVIADGKRLYLKRHTSTRGIKRTINNLLIEQDILSPHRYLTDKFTINKDDVLVDVGAAEGNLALSVIERVKKVYLFETDENWIEALQATFSPWKDKVVIVNKFVSNKNDDKNISLDQFFKDNEIFNFLKVDAEGSEDEVIKGCEKLLSADQKMKIALCTYHRPTDDKIFSEILENKDFSVTFSQGYMIYNYPDTFTPPYLRRGVIRAER
jgi:hypothetical protein